MARIESQAKGGYYPTPPQALEQLAEAINSGYVTYSQRDNFQHDLLDPCCGEGYALASIKAGMGKGKGSNCPQIKTYGVEINPERAKTAAEYIDEVMECDLLSSQIGHESFGIVYLNPPYDLEGDGTGKRIELAFLKRCTPYLMPYGCLIFIVPHYILREATAQYLASHYDLWQIWPFPEKEFELYGQVAVIGKKRTTPIFSPKNFKYLEEVSRQNDPYKAEDPFPSNPYIKRENGNYKLFGIIPPISPAGRKILFSPLFMDPLRICEEARESGLWHTAKIQEALWPKEKKSTRPLQPLKKGHLAVLTAAGFLDNRVLTNGETRVLVKGQTYKEMETVSEDLEKKVEREKTRVKVTQLDLGTGKFSTIYA